MSDADNVFNTFYSFRLLSWEDFFKVSSPTAKRVTSHEEFSSSSSVYVTDSLVAYSVSAGNGGAILFSSSSDDSFLLVERTTIANCRSNGQGGGIYFGNKGHFILSKVCGFNCSTTGNYHRPFAYVVVSGYGYENEMHDTSV